ncbi:MAG: LCP family protein [Oscillospiraceae bacterium]
MKLFGSKDSKNAQHAAPRRSDSPEQTRDKKPREKTAKAGDGKRSRVWKRVLIVVAAIILVIAAVIIGYSIWERPPEIENTGFHNPSAEQSGSQDTQPGDPDSPGSVDDPDDQEGALVTDRNDGVYTFLVVGRDQASNSTDTIILAKFDTKAHTIDCVNIPRDTLINISWSSPKKINTVYAGYINSGKDGVEGLKTHIKKLIGFDVDCYVVVSLAAVEQAVDCIGGIWFDVPVRMNYYDPTQDFRVDLQPGYQLLNGEQALGAFRYRAGYDGGDIERIGVQQDLLKAVASQMLSLGSIPHLTELIQIVLDNVETDLTAANIAYFAREFLKCSMDDIQFSTMPFTGNWINGVSYVSVDIPAWLDMVNQCLNPYAQDVTESNVDILIANYDGSSLYATTGAVAGGTDSFYCMSCYGHHAPGQCPAAQTSGDAPAEGTEEME